jgi:hypothetical protein
MIDLIMRLANTLAGLGGQLHNLKRDRRDRIADLLTVIADCIADITTQIRSTSGDVPLDRCSELTGYLHHLAIVAKREIPDDQLSDLLQELREASNSRRFIYIIRNELGYKKEMDDQIRNALITLDTANGSFRAVANLLRAS